MSTTRHLINRQRRLATTGRTPAPASTTALPEKPGRERRPEKPEKRGKPKRPDRTAEPSSADDRQHRGIRLPAVLCVLTVLLGAAAAVAFSQASGLRDEPAARNTALTDIARTSEVKGQITQAVESVFSYNFANPAASEQAAKKHLTGKAVQQHGEMLADVRKQGPKQKLVLTTTVTESGVELIDGDRARVLVFADQSNTRTASKDERTYAAAMLAVDVVRGDGTWRIATIDTFGAGS